MLSVRHPLPATGLYVYRSRPDDLRLRVPIVRYSTSSTTHLPRLQMHAVDPHSSAKNYCSEIFLYSTNDDELLNATDPNRAQLADPA